MNGKIIIAEYDPTWPAKFAAEAGRIKGALGEWLISLHHIGSTSVEGLAAKPVIDMLGAVRDLAEVNQHCVGRLAELGYEYVPRYEDEMPDRRYFRWDNEAGVREYQLHVYEAGHPEWWRHKVFRDYLREHPAEREAYARLKRELAPQFTDTNEYAGAKTDFIREVDARAARWAAGRNQNTADKTDT